MIPTTAAAALPVDLPRSRSASSLGATVALARLLGRPTLAQRSTWALPVAALGVVSALVLTVAGGAVWFWHLSGEIGGLYKLFAAVAVMLLVVPLATLAGAAARLSAARRDDRLASLRLIGATTATVRLLTLAETGAIAVAGAVVGLAGYAALTPLVGLLTFAGRRVGAGGLWPGFLVVAVVVLALAMLTVASAAVGLRRVEISPLGVRTRQEAPGAHWLRLVLGVAAIAGAAVLAQNVNVASGKTSVVVIAIMAAIGGPLLAVNLLGPWLVRRLATRDLRRAGNATQLLSARSVLESPKGTWRQVGGVAMVSFVAVVLGVALSFGDNGSLSPEDRMLLHDMRLGVQVTLAIAFVTVACSVSITQAAAVLDRRALYVNLDMAGTPFRVLDAARRRAVLAPLVWVVLVSVVSAALVVSPLAGVNHLSDPTSMLATAGMLVGGVGLVVAALGLTRGTLRTVVGQGVARVE